jgi:apolipoprotein D and lipocalin family protein
VEDEQSNALWGMQFIWPFKGDYRIIYLDEDYSTTIIGRNKRDYVWLMAREPQMPAAEYQKAVDFIQGVGYDIENLQRVPQQW